MEFKGTKGKWFCENINGHLLIKSLNVEDVKTIAQVYYVKDENGNFDKQAEYNQLLISETTEMRKLLEKTFFHIDAIARRLPYDSEFKQGLKGRAEEIKQLLKKATEI